MTKVTEGTKTFRASRMPLAWICPSSAHGQAGPIRIDWRHVAGATGSASHEVFKDMVLEFGGEPPEDYDPYLDRWGLTDSTELRVIAEWTAQFWRDWGVSYPNPVMEEPLEKPLGDGAKLTGHPDLYSLICEGKAEPVEARVIDDKTGRLKDMDFGPQLKSYCVLLKRKYPSLKEFNCTLMYPRDQEMDTTHYTDRDIREFEEELIRRIVKWDGHSYTHGGHCRFCPRGSSCVAQRALVQSTVKSLMSTEDVLESMTPAVAVKFCRHIKVVREQCKKAEDYIRLMVREAGGRLYGNDGHDLVLKRDKPTDVILPQEAWPVLEVELSQHELPSVVSITKGRLMDIVSARAERGQKKKECARVMESLRRVGAVVQAEGAEKLWVEAVKESAREIRE